MKKKKIILLTLILVGVVAALFFLFRENNTNSPRHFDVPVYTADDSPSKQEIMSICLNMTPEECADYYVKNRTTIDFFDTLFGESIIPLFENCSYCEIKNIKLLTTNTPICNQIENLYTFIREDYLNEIHETLSDFADEQKNLFIDTILPLALIDLDTLFAGDFENVINDYIGCRVKVFDSVDDFEKAWNKNIDSKKYETFVNNTLEDYRNSVLVYYTDFYEELNIDRYRLPDLPKCEKLDLSFPRETVEKYVETGNEESLTIAIDTGIDILLYFTGGKIINIIVNIKDYGTTAYDVYKYISGDNISEEEKLFLGISEIINIKITNDLKSKYYKYFDQQTELMFNQIKENL